MWKSKPALCTNVSLPFLLVLVTYIITLENLCFMALYTIEVFESLRNVRISIQVLNIKDVYYSQWVLICKKGVEKAARARAHTHTPKFRQLCIISLWPEMMGPQRLHSVSVRLRPRWIVIYRWMQSVTRIKGFQRDSSTKEKFRAGLSLARLF